MEKITRKEIEDACEELKSSLISSIELDEKEQNVKLQQTKNHHRLLLAKDSVRALKIWNQKQ